MSAKQKFNLLNNLKSITFKFYPEGLNNKSIRSCIPLATTGRVKKLSPDCKVSVSCEPRECDPEIKLKYYNGFEQSIFTKNLDLAAIVESIEMKKKSLRVEEIKLKKTPDTTLEEILTPVTKKKDTGAKANLRK